MKTSFISLLFLSVTIISLEITAQTLVPNVVFREDPLTHNMHLTSDRKYLYTCNGGKRDQGQISKFSLKGDKIASYKIELDMRSIMYNSDDKKLYVSTYDQKLYRINNLEMGNYSEAWSFSDRNEQSAPAFSPDGKKLYFYQDGNLYIYDFRKRELKETIYNLEPEAGISLLGTTVAADEKNIYTWSHEEQIVAVYDLKGKYRKSYKLNQGDYSFSLSYANGMLWVSTDGNYETGTWYGYKLK